MGREALTSRWVGTGAAESTNDTVAVDAAFLADAG